MPEQFRRSDLQYTYDTGTNGWGRLTGVSWGPLVSGQTAYTESYGYTIAGDMSAKELTVYKSSGQVNLGGSFAYDSEGKPSTLTYPGAGYSSTGIVQTYTYDFMSRLTGVSNVEGAGAVSPCTPASPTTATVTWATGGAYNAAGQLTDLERFGGIGYTCTGAVEGYFNEHWQYNALNQLAEIDTSAQSGGFPVSSTNPGTANVFFTRYNFSATQNNGQAMSVDDARQSGANIAYTYDPLKRLTKAKTTSWTQNIGYDGFGNITSKDVPTGSAEPAFPGAVSSKNWLTGVSYDLNGNALGVNAFALTYDAENRLATATSGSAVESYSYDESNHRLEKIFGTSDYLYFYGPGGKLLSIRQVTGGTTSVVADRVYFGGLLLGSAGAMGSQDVSTLADRLGTAATGYPYGTDKGNPPGNDQPDFATYTKDATTGFEYANQRYYSAGLGRFLTTDPYGDNWDPANPGSWNEYGYANGDPIGSNDPDGLDCSDVALEGWAGIPAGTTVGDFISSNSDLSVFAETVYTESRIGWDDTAAYEKEAISAVIMNRWQFVNGYYDLYTGKAGSRGSRQVRAVPDWGNADGTLASIVFAPGQFAVWSSPGSLTGDAQKRLNAALKADDTDDQCISLLQSIGTVAGFWSARDDHTLYSSANDVFFTSFGSGAGKANESYYETTIGSFGSGNIFYGVNGNQLWPHGVPLPRTAPPRVPRPPGRRR